MVANTLLTEKKYLDIQGLVALIQKIANLRQEYLDRFDTDEQDYTDLLERVDAVVAGLGKDLDFDGATGATLLEKVATAINAIRADLGLPVDGAVAFDDIRALQEEVEKADTGLLDRTTALEAGAYQGFEYTFDNDANKATVAFKNAAGDELGHFDMDLSKFVLDAMIGDVRIVRVTGGTAKDGIAASQCKVFNYNTGDDLTDELGAEAYAANYKLNEPYMVYKFKTGEHGADGDKAENPDVQATYKNIWVDLAALHDDYRFDAATADEGYVSLEAELDTHKTGSVNNVKYTVALGDTAKEDFSLVEGHTMKDPANAAVGNYSGIIELNDRMDDAEDEIDALQEEVEKADTGLLDRTSKLENQVVNGVDGAPGLLDRAADIEEWINTKAIAVSAVEAYFESVVNKVIFTVTPSLSDDDKTYEVAPKA